MDIWNVGHSGPVTLPIQWEWSTWRTMYFLFHFQINYVFDHMNVTQDYQGPVLFLEEDHFVSPDFYHVLRLLNEARKRYTVTSSLRNMCASQPNIVWFFFYIFRYGDCNQGCEILSLGAYKLVEDYNSVGPNQVCLSTLRCPLIHSHTSSDSDIAIC